MKYLAIGFWTEMSSGNSFTLSRETDLHTSEDLLSFLCAEAQMEEMNIDTILLLKNGDSSGKPPQVCAHYGAEEFSYLFDESDDDSYVEVYDSEPDSVRMS